MGTDTDKPKKTPTPPKIDSPKTEVDPAPEVLAGQAIDQIIEDAVGVAMEAFERRHPTTARYLKRRLGDPLEFVMQKLQEDESYGQLVADTEKALDMAQVVKVIVSVALRVAEHFLVAV